MLIFLAGAISAAMPCSSDLDAFRGVATAVMPDKGVSDWDLMLSASFNEGLKEYCMNTVLSVIDS